MIRLLGCVAGEHAIPFLTKLVDVIQFFEFFNAKITKCQTLNFKKKRAPIDGSAVLGSRQQPLSTDSKEEIPRSLVPRKSMADGL